MKFDLSKLEGFEWDNGNIDKNKFKHSVSDKEAEEIFHNKQLIIFPDEKHSNNSETRWGAFGKTDLKRKLTIFFTFRKKNIRIISARDQNKREKIYYKGGED